MNFLRQLAQQSQPNKWLLGLTLIGVIGIGDFLTGYELAFSLFYVLPIAWLTWFLGKQAGSLAAVLSALMGLAANAVAGQLTAQPLILIWNSLINLGFFALSVYLLVTLSSSLTREKTLTRVDRLTGAINAPLFFEQLQIEIERSHRYAHPFTLVYIDLDNFNGLNAQHGFATGDKVLCTVVGCAKIRLRKLDVIARLGNDEFALLLPETNLEAAQTALAKLQSELLAAMRQNNWPITYSIGAVVCSGAGHATAEELVRMVQNLMQAVKSEGKNAIKYTTYPD